MHGHRAWPDDYGNCDDVLDPHASPVLPESYEFLGGGHESVWLLNVMLRRTAGSTATFSTSLDGVCADYLSVFRDTLTNELVAVWRIAQDTPLLGEEDVLRGSSLWSRLDTEPAPRIVTTADDDILLVATTGADAVVVADQIGGWQSPTDASDSAEAPDIRHAPALPTGTFGCVLAER
jgi:hypothetical protein